MRWTPSTVFRELIAGGAVVSAFLLVASYWSALPDKVAIHFGLSGRPDFWAAKETILIVPVVGFILWLLMITIRRYPQRFNYPVEITPANRERQEALAIGLIDWVRLETSLLFAFLTSQEILVSLKMSEGLSLWFLPVTLVIISATIWTYFRAARRDADSRLGK